MDQSLSFDADAISMIYAEEVATSFQTQMQEVERLASELHNLLVSYGAPRDQEDPESNLARWAECYRRGLMAADKIRRDGCALLQKAGGVINQRPRTAAISDNHPVNGAVFRAMEFEDHTRNKGSIMAQQRSNLFGERISGTARMR